MATSDPLESLEAAAELKLARLENYREAITLAGGYVFAPWSGVCIFCSADLVALHAQGRSVSTGCPSCHRTFVE